MQAICPPTHPAQYVGMIPPLAAARLAEQKQMLELILDLRFGVANIIRSNAPITFPLQRKLNHSQAPQPHTHAPTTTEQQTQPEPPRALSRTTRSLPRPLTRIVHFGNYETPDVASDKRAAEWQGCNEPIAALLNDAANEESIAVRLSCRHSSQFALLTQQSNQI